MDMNLASNVFRSDECAHHRQMLRPHLAINSMTCLTLREAEAVGEAVEAEALPGSNWVSFQFSI